MINPKKFIVDTNVLISALMIRTSIAYKVLEYCIYNGVLLFSNETFSELDCVLSRRKFDKYFSDTEKMDILYEFTDIGNFNKTRSDFKMCRDASDDKFLNLAVDGNACCIVTGDKDLLTMNPFGNIPILTSTQFLYYFNEFGGSLILNEPESVYDKA